MPFLSPNQQRQSTEGKISHSMDLLTPSSPGGLPTLSLTTNSSWLPWRRFAMPLISPLMPVLLVLFLYCCINIFYIPVVVDIVVVVVVKSITVLLLIMMHKLRMCSEPRHCSMWVFVVTFDLPVLHIAFYVAGFLANLHHVTWKQAKNTLVKISYSYTTAVKNNTNISEAHLVNIDSWTWGTKAESETVKSIQTLLKLLHVIEMKNFWNYSSHPTCPVSHINPIRVKRSYIVLHFD